MALTSLVHRLSMAACTHHIIAISSVSPLSLLFPSNHQPQNPPALPFEFLCVPILVAPANLVRSHAPCILPHPSITASSQPGDSDTKQASKTTSSNFSHSSPSSTAAMAVPPKFAAHKLEFGSPPAAHTASSPSASSVPHTTHTLELYVDYCCPFSAKQFLTLTRDVFPLVRANPSWASLLAVVFRQQVQPWHPSSTLLHESALAVLRLDPAKFWEYSAALFDAQKDFFDVNVVNEPRNQTYRRLAKLAAQSVGLDEAKVYALLEVPDRPAQDGSLNVGNQVTNDLKLLTKMNRLVGVHVTPTVVFDGVVHDTSSSWSVDQWKEWLDKNVV